MTMTVATPITSTLRFSTARDALSRIDRRIAALANPLHRSWLTTYRDHWWCEVIGDVDGVMATMSRGPIRYVFDGHPFLTPEGGLSSVTTWEDTRAMYAGVVALGVRMAGSFDHERILFDDTGLGFHSTLSAVYPGAFITKYGEPIDPAGFYVVRWPNIVMVHYDAYGLMQGEEIYNGTPIMVKRIKPTEVDCLVEGPLPIDA